MEIRPATRDKLGAIIVGDGFDITEEGILTVDEDSVKQEEYVEFSRERLDELYEASKLRRQ